MRSTTIPHLSLLLALAFLVSCTGGAAARTLSVPEDAATIKAAMGQAEAGDIILVACGTYREAGIHFKSGVALWSGTLQPACVTVDGQGRGPVFLFSQADTTTAIVGLTIVGGAGSGGGAMRLQNASPRISNCIFENNQATEGGALRADASSQPLLKNCLFRNNAAAMQGGAVLAEGGLELQDCAFENNTALIGGALAGSARTDLRITGSSFLQNVAGNTGGALHLNAGRAVVSGTVLAENSGGLGGSALSLHDARVTLEACTLVGNTADSEGAVVACQGLAPTVTNTIVAFSKAEVLRADSSVPEFRGCNLYGNQYGDWESNLRPLADRHRNISRDPMFCAPEYGNFQLKNGSACLPGHNPSGNDGVVGAFGAGCAATGPPPADQRAQGSGFHALKAGF